MEWFDALFAWLPAGRPQALARSGVLQAGIAIALLLPVWWLERRHGLGRAEYIRGRNFRHDLVYWFYYRTGLSGLLYTTALLALLHRPLSFLDIGLGARLPGWLVIVLALLIGDVTSYWAHRLQHRIGVLWAFHTTHHSQPDLNIFTGARFHPVDALFLALCAYVPMRLIAGGPELWPWLAMTLWTVNMLIHSRLPWSYGPLYGVVVSPAFHAFHHSVLPEHHDRNFSSGLLSVWDYLFGTAVRRGAAEPQVFGLGGPPPRSFLDTLLEPFRLLARQWRPAPTSLPRPE